MTAGQEPVELCGTRLFDESWTGDHSFHHRQPRGMGGSRRREVNSPANVMLLCGSGTTGCHGFIEKYRSSAEQEGWLVRHGQDPAEVPVTVFGGWNAVTTMQGVKIRDHIATRRVLLTDAGDYQEVAA
ncbi:hypothetical protein [Nocardioides aquiterrae]|uniref:HNH endonuclease n=1 Tax=Nocardioides aquiterrae TaxID=203799 RepID=A0ABN1UCP7_9ACTN